MFIVIRGFIKYRDVFDHGREANFRYVWRYSLFSPKDGSERFGSWEKCGPEEQNKET